MTSPLRFAVVLLLGVVAATSGCGIVKARVIVDGKHYDADGTARENPVERVRNATKAMVACSEEAHRAQAAFVHDAVPAVSALSAALSRSAGGDAASVTYGEVTEDPMIRVTVAPPKPVAKRAATQAPFAPAATALSASLRQSLDATSHCSTANLAAIKAVWDEQRYISQPDTHELLETHWRATQALARSKELTVSCISLASTIAEAGHGKPGGLAAAARVLEERGDKLFSDVAFDHNLRREVMIQGLRDTSDGCGTRDEKGKTSCDKAADAFKSAKTAVDAVQDVRAGRILDALNKAMALSDDGEAKLRRDKARREAVLPLIPETPALERSREVLDVARTSHPHEVRARGETIVSSDGVLALLSAPEKAPEK